MVRVTAITPAELVHFMRTNLQTMSFSLYIHILTEPFINVLCELPANVKKYSRVFLDEEKDKINKYAARRLFACGYKQLYFVRKLHAKLLVTDKFVVIGSANFSERAVTQNFEVILVVWTGPRHIDGLVSILADIEKRAIRILPKHINK